MPDSKSNPMSFSPFSALVGLGGNLLSGTINAHLQQQQNAENRHLAREQNRWNREQWLREMAYNLPSAQMKRLREAGINPALAYTNGVDNLAPVSPEMVSSQGVAPNIGNPFASFARDLQNAELVESQVKLNESAANRNNADAGLKEVQIQIAGVNLKIITKTGMDIAETKLAGLKKNIELIQSQIDNISQDTAIKILEENKLQYYIDQIQPAELEKLKSETGLNDASAKQILELLPYEILLRKAMADNNNAQARFANANAEFQEKLNDSSSYVKNFIKAIELDNEGKIVSMALNAGQHISDYRVGLSEIGHTGEGLGTGASGTDAAVVGAETAFGIVGRLFSIILKH